jgi:hypothetical protein
MYDLNTKQMSNQHVKFCKDQFEKGDLGKIRKPSCRSRVLLRSIVNALVMFPCTIVRMRNARNTNPCLRCAAGQYEGVTNLFYIARFETWYATFTQYGDTDIIPLPLFSSPLCTPRFDFGAPSCITILLVQLQSSQLLGFSQSSRYHFSLVISLGRVTA